MLGYLILLFILIPVIELTLVVKISQDIGISWMVVAVILPA